MAVKCVCVYVCVCVCVCVQVLSQYAGLLRAMHSLPTIDMPSLDSTLVCVRTHDKHTMTLAMQRLASTHGFDVCAHADSV